MGWVIDWPRLLGDLAWLYGDLDPGDPNQRLRIAIGTATLADRLLISRGALRNWIDGTEPRHSDGEMLIARWAAITGKQREHLPRMVAVLSSARA